MVKNHMKRITAPKTWNVARKTTKFITKPHPGAHKLGHGVAINTFFKELVKLTNTTKETKYVLTNDEVLVNGRRRRDFKTQVGFLDIVSVKSLNMHFLLTVDSKGALRAKEIDEVKAKSRLLKIKGKVAIGSDKFQLNTFAGENLIVLGAEAKKYAVGDSLIVEVGSMKILDYLNLKEKSLVFVYQGKHSGKSGVLESENEKTVTIKSGDSSFETSDEYLIAINKEKLAEFE